MTLDIDRIRAQAEEDEVSGPTIRKLCDEIERLRDYEGAIALWAARQIKCHPADIRSVAINSKLDATQVPIIDIWYFEVGLNEEENHEIPVNEVPLATIMRKIMEPDDD